MCVVVGGVGNCAVQLPWQRLRASGGGTIRTEGDCEKEEDKLQACHLLSAGTVKEFLE